MVHFYGYEIDKTAYIGLSYVFPNHLKMEKRKQSIVMENGLHQMNIGRGIQYVHIRILY